MTNPMLDMELLPDDWSKNDRTIYEVAGVVFGVLTNNLGTGVASFMRREGTNFIYRFRWNDLHGTELKYQIGFEIVRFVVNCDVPSLLVLASDEASKLVRHVEKSVTCAG